MTVAAIVADDSELRRSPTLGEVWGFPVRRRGRRRDMAIGALLLVALPGVGWVLNLGHRWRVMERLYTDDPPWFRGFTPLGGTLARGLGVVAMGGAYLGPGAIVVAVGLSVEDARSGTALVGLGFALLLLAFHSFPVAMARFAMSRDVRWLVGHRMAYREACSHGRPYVRMWAITWTAIALSVTPLAAAAAVAELAGDPRAWWIALPTAVLSPWAWSSLGYGFGTIIVPQVRARELASRSGVDR